MDNKNTKEFYYTKGCFGKSVLSFIIMVFLEGGTIALTILAKTIMTGGLSPYVFVVYTSALTTLILIPYSNFYHWSERTEQSLFTLISRVFLLGFIGITLSQNLAFVGLKYSSPIMVCAMGLLSPSFSFLLSSILRKTKLEWRSSSFQIKVIGTIVSVIGACMADLYLGPAVQKSEAHLFWNASRYFVYLSTMEYWEIGGVLLAAATFFIAVWNIIQVGASKEYPHVMKLAAFYSFMGTIQTALFALFMERDDLSAWKLTFNWDLKLIIMTALFNGIMRPRIHIWCTKMHGPTYVPLFQPFRIMWASYFGSTYFAKTLHYGSVIASCIGGVGFYTVMWGNIKGEEKPKQYDIERVDSPEQKVPLLQEEVAEV